VTGGFRSNWGADLFAAVRSVVGTAARHGTDAYQAIHAILGGASSRVVEQLQRLMRRGCFL
jgi:transposase